MGAKLLKHINRFRDRHGKLRHYFRRRGMRKAIPLPGLPGSDDFMTAYAAALGRSPIADIGADRTQPGTIDALAVTHYRSDEWRALASDTQKTRRRIIEKFRTRNGPKRVALVTREHMEKALAEIDKPGARRHFLKAIRGLFNSAVPAMRKDNPTDGIAGIKMPKTKGHHTWTEAQVEQYRAYWKLGTQQRLVMEFALEAVSRRCEVVRLGPQHVKNGWIKIERMHGSADVEIPMTPELQAACDTMPKGHLTYIVTAHGKPRSVAGLGNDFARWATEAGLPNCCRLHGLKKAGMSRLAEDGATTHELMGISGHKTLSEVQRYTAEADRKRLAAAGMAKKGRGQSENSNVTNLPAPRSQTRS